MNDYVFALDIGTQSVTGIILEKKDAKYVVIDYYIEQHEERSMLDGQIHNVVAVSEVIMNVKSKLEQSYGPLNQVAVAAAGRALKTVQAEYEKDISTYSITHNEEVKHLELSAVQKAQHLLAKNKDKHSYNHYHCVGYSVLHYRLDGEKIGSLIDQTGEKVSVEIIATFLPKIVIDSLLAALDRANLKMGALTLEPIAAIHVLIPQSMRRLNVALIDIGAGTSDIAITNDGTVTAYGMVPLAGDKITETMSDEYLLDFKIAEQAKQNIVNNGKTSVSDILGFETTITYDDLILKVNSAVDELASLITEEVFNLNGKPPKAVMLIGGGSLTPLLREKVAESLQLPYNRVAIRDIEAIQQLDKSEILPDGPDFVTPIGIAVTAQQNPIHYVNVTVNNQTVRMFEVNNLTVGDCLIQTGIELEQFYGRPGLASIVTVNGEKVTLPGAYGEKPIIYVNGIEQSVDAIVQDGDQINIKKGENGSEPHITIKQLIGKVEPISFYFNNERTVLNATIHVNGAPVNEQYIIQDNDNIVTYIPKTVKDFIEDKDINETLQLTSFFVYVNNKKVVFDDGKTEIYINDKLAKLNDFIKENDHVILKTQRKVTVQMLLSQLQRSLYKKIDVTFNGKLITLKEQQITIERDGKPLNIEDELIHLDHITITEKKLEPFIFQDIFRYVDFDNKPKGKKRYELYKNGEKTTFFEQIQPGDQLELIWEN